MPRCDGEAAGALERRSQRRPTSYPELAQDGVRLHPAEHDRLDSLASYGVLDTPQESAYDELTALAARLCGTPFAAVTLVDGERQWFKSRQGLALQQTARELSFCSDVVAGGQVLAVPDARDAVRYRDNPLVVGEPGMRSYLGVPLVGRDGLPLGALCVIDRRARTFTPDQVDVLSTLAQQVVHLLEQRRRDLLDGLLSVQVLDEARDPVRLRAALLAGELVPHFQPLVDLRTGRPHQVEALLRWEHPQLGTLGPAAFLPTIEASALVVPVGRAVLDAALAQLAAMERLGVHLPGGVAVNVASGQLARPGLARDVLASWTATTCSARRSPSRSPRRQRCSTPTSRAPSWTPWWRWACTSPLTTTASGGATCRGCSSCPSTRSRSTAASPRRWCTTRGRRRWWPPPWSWLRGSVCP
jgi:hypothetical protein